jgi:CheY-like chemotaxis protein
MKILVVDDETDVRILFEQRFRREIRSGEFSFSFAYSGEEALTYLQTTTPRWCYSLRHQHARHERAGAAAAGAPAVPGAHAAAGPVVMMLTAYGDQETHDQAMQLGADDFLTKPVDFAALKAKLLEMEHKGHETPEGT